MVTKNTFKKKFPDVKVQPWLEVLGTYCFNEKTLPPTDGGI